MCSPRKHGTGFTLVELLTAMSLAAMIITGSVRIAAAASSSYRLQQNLAALQANARFAMLALRREIAQAGFTPGPWDSASRVPAIASGTGDAATARGDRLSVSRWSRHNCFENPNPVLDADGQPAHFLLENSFAVNASGSLTVGCRYGADGASLVTQVNNQGLVNDVVSLQLLYAQDSDGDGNADRWRRGGDWDDESGVLAVRIGLLLATPESIGGTPASQFALLDTTVPVPGDGRSYRVFETVAAIEGRLR